MKKYLLTLCIVFTFVCVNAANAADYREATLAAQDWLVLMDSGKYAESWDAAAGYFRNMVMKEDWNRMAAGVRNPLGDLKSRKQASSKYATSLPGAPDGEYVVMTFKSSFTNKKKAVETVTCMKDEDGVWRVSGYFIK